MEIDALISLVKRTKALLEDSCRISQVTVRLCDSSRCCSSGIFEKERKDIMKKFLNHGILLPEH